MQSNRIVGRYTLGAILTASVMLGSTTASFANHQWDNYHLQIPTGDSAVHVGVTFHDIAGPADQATYESSLDDWQTKIDQFGGDVSIDSGVTQVTDSGNPVNSNGELFLDAYRNRIAQSYNCEWDDSDLDPANDCPTVVSPGVSGTNSNPIPVNAFDGGYGNTGWLGIAIVEDELTVGTGTTHIFYGEIYINESYASTFALDPDGPRYVFCQEFGHVGGLDHIKKDDGSCMYTPRSPTRPFGSVAAPNDHDGEMINLISHDETAHGGGGGGGGGGDGGGNCPPRGPNACFQLNPKITAFWEQRFENEEDMFDEADLVVSATVLSGSSFSHMEGYGGPSVPVSHVVLKVNETYKGFSKPVITLVQNRGPGFEIDDDPGYVQGDDYTLYLVNLGSGNYRIVSPDGRIRQ